MTLSVERDGDGRRWRPGGRRSNGRKGSEEVFESEEAAQKTQERILSALDELIAERMSEVEKSDAGNDAGPEGD